MLRLNKAPEPLAVAPNFTPEVGIPEVRRGGNKNVPLCELDDRCSETHSNRIVPAFWARSRLSPATCVKPHVCAFSPLLTIFGQSEGEVQLPIFSPLFLFLASTPSVWTAPAD